MGKIRRKFSDEFKRNVIEQVVSGELTQAEAARKYQVSAVLIAIWKKKLTTGEFSSFNESTFKEMALERENAKLKEKVGELYMQVEMLKKLKNWVAQQRSENSSVITSLNLEAFQGDVK